jgi:hypothetical protein
MISYEYEGESYAINILKAFLTSNSSRLFVVLIIVVVVVIVALVHSCCSQRLLADPWALGRLVLLGALDGAAVPLEAVVAASDLLGADGVGEGGVAVGDGEVGRGLAHVRPCIKLGPVAEKDLGYLEMAVLSSPVKSSPAFVVGAVPVAAVVEQVLGDVYMPVITSCHEDGCHEQLG